jgi:hypothetical protein
MTLDAEIGVSVRRPKEFTQRGARSDDAVPDLWEWDDLACRGGVRAALRAILVAREMRSGLVT